MAAHVAQVSPPPSRPRRRRHPWRAVPGGARRRVCRAVRPQRAVRAYPPPAVADSLRARGAARRSLRVWDHQHVRPGSVSVGVCRGPRRPLRRAPVRPRRVLPVCRSVLIATSSDRGRGSRNRVSVRDRHARPRPVLAHHPRGSHLPVPRAGRCRAVLPDRHGPGRTIRLLRRPRGHLRATLHRVSHLAADHSAVDGAGRGTAAGVERAADLLRHRHHSVAGELGRAGARGCAASCWSCASTTS